MRSRVVLSIVIGARLIGSHGIAVADDDHQKADKLFDEAQKLRADGKKAEACAKYEAALQHNPNAVGALLNVGLCNEEAGKYATAVRLYTQARDLAREGGYVEHRAAAEERLTAASPFVSHLAIAFAEQPSQMKLVIDDQVIPIDKSEDIVIDPGSHHVVVTAPGRVPWETTVTVEKSSAKAVAVPKLDYPVTVKKGRRTVGIIVTASGAAMIGTGIGLGLYARSKYYGQIGPGKRCTDEDPPRCDSEGYRITNDARTFGTFGTWIGLGGVAVAGVGAYLWFFGPKGTAERSVAIVPALAPESAGVTAFGRF
jgi:hypothetical protein